MLKIFKKIDARVEKNQIGNIWRLRLTKVKTNQQKDAKRMINPVLVECKSRVMRNNILKKKKKLAIANFDDFSISGINNVYI